MLRNACSTTYALMYFLVALSVLGVVVSSQQYLILQSEETMTLARQTLEESFLSAISRGAGGESNPEIAQRLAQRKTAVEGIYSSAAGIIRQLKIRALAETIAWCVVFIISSWILIINYRRQSAADTSHASTSE